MRLFLIAVSLLFLINLQGYAQSDEPKLGLVLSGGGARGLAHIGIIRELEAQGIYPDYITGTSMGSLVGALYAIGYTPDEMEDLVLSADWDQLLGNRITLNDITIEEKPYMERYLTELLIENGSLSLPKGVIEGHYLNDLFSKITRSVHHIHDFSKFPIPYACIGTDVSNGDKVVLNKGFLPEAMRASMAIPSVFTPVEIDGRLLVDGGLVRNLPVEEVREMGADLVIGVFVSQGLSSKEDISSIVDVLRQSTFLYSAKDSKEQMAMADLLIVPDLEGYYSQSFDQAEGIVEAGNRYGKLMADSIRHFKERYLSNKVMKPAQKLPQVDNFEISEVVVEGNKDIDSEYILGKLQISGDETISIHEIESRMNLLYGTRYFSKVNYTFDQRGDEEILRVKVEEMPKKTLSFAAHYDSENKVGINLNLTLRNTFLENSRFLTEIDAAEFPRLDMSYFKYLGVKQRVALVLGGKWEYLNLADYDSLGGTNAIFSTNYYQLYAQLQVTNHHHYTYGIKYSAEWGDLKPKLGEGTVDIIDKLSIFNNSIGAFWSFNTLNRRYFTTKGLDIESTLSYKFNPDGELRGFGGLNNDTPVTVPINIDDYYQFKLSFRSFIPLHNRLTLSLQTNGVLSDLDPNSLNLIDYQFIGGFNPRYISSHIYWGANAKEWSTISYSMGAAMLQYEFKSDMFLQSRINYIEGEYPMKLLGMDVPEAYFNGEHRRLGFGAAIGYQSKLGPILFALAKDVNKSSWRPFFNIGFYF